MKLKTARRNFIRQTATAVLFAGVANLNAGQTRPRKMTLDLVCGNIGVSATQREAIDLAARNGFESVGADGAYLASLSKDQLADLKGLMKNTRISKWTTAANCPAPRG